MKKQNRQWLYATSAITMAAMPLFAMPALSQDTPNPPAGSEPAATDSEIIVTGFRRSLDSALAIKREAPTFVDSIVAEDIGKFPDQNVAEALQRITGVSISRSNGEGSQVTVRGFGPAFNRVTLNGRTLTSALPGRDFDFQVISSDLIAGADVAKSPQASVPEGSIGATIDLTTTRPLNGPAGFSTTLAARGRYNDLRGGVTPEASALVRYANDEKTLGFSLGISYQKGRNRVDQSGGTRSSLYDATGQTDAVDEAGAPIPGRLVRHAGRWEYSLGFEERERIGVTTALQAEFNDNLTLTVDGLFSKFKRDTDLYGMQLPILTGDYSDLTISKNSTLLAFTAGTVRPQRIDLLQLDNGSNSRTYAGGINLKGEYSDISFSLDANYSRSSGTARDNFYVPQIGSGVGNDFGSFTFDIVNRDVPNATSTIAVNNPSLVRAHYNLIQFDKVKDKLGEFQGNVTWSADRGILESISAGVYYSRRTKRLDHFESDGELNCRATCGTGIDLPDGVFGVTDVDNFLSGEPGNFFRQFVFIKDLPGYFSALETIKGDPFVAVLTPRASSVTKERIFGGFLQANFKGTLGSSDWRGNIGVRFARTSTSAAGVRQSIASVQRLDPDDPNTSALLVSFSPEAPVTIKNSYTDVLPSMNFSIDLTDRLVLRTAAARVITRPAITDLSVAQTYQTSNVETYSVSGGNPLLKPYVVDQADLGLEFYGGNTSLSAAFYYKKIKSFISESTILVGTGIILPFSGELVQAQTSKRNRTGGNVGGVELAATHYFRYLPGFLSGFGVQANYTYAKSKDKNAPPIALPLVTEPDSAVEGFAKNTANVVVFFEGGPLQARIAYNWRDRFLLSRQGSRSFGLPEYVAPYGQFDFSMSLKLNETFTASVEGINITNQRVLRYEDVRERVSLVQYSGRRILFGLRATF